MTIEERVTEQGKAIDLLVTGLAQHQELLHGIVATLREHSQRFDRLEKLIRDTHPHTNGTG